MIENLTPFRHNEKPNYIRGWYIPEKICDDLILLFENNQDKHIEGKSGTGVVDKSIKDSTDLSINFYDEIAQNQSLYAYTCWLSAFVELYKDEFKSIGKQLHPWGIVENINIQKYNPCQGFHKIHCENNCAQTSHRILVFQTYLNTVTDGGETEFPEHKFKTPAEKGLTILFPAGWTHPHRGCVSNTETKYIITGWFSYNSNPNASR